jgi:sensor histidine kinase regulating citrate/malate metabolism
VLPVGRTFGRLNRRFALGTAAGLLVSSLVFFVLYLGLYQEQLARQREETATQISRLLRTSLENAMLKCDLDGIREIVNRLGQQPGISAVTITNATGQIRFSSQPG